MKKANPYFLFLWCYSLLNNSTEAFQALSRLLPPSRRSPFAATHYNLLPLSPERPLAPTPSKRKDDKLLHPYRLSLTVRMQSTTDVIEQLTPAPLQQEETLNSTTLPLQRTNSTCTFDNKTGIYPPTPTFLECLAFALPALGIYICPPLMSLIDASFIGQLSTSVELAALGPASTISDSAPLPLLFLSIATTNLIAKSYAQRDGATSTRVSRTALGVGTVCSTILAGLLTIMARPISFLYCGCGFGAAAATTAAAQQQMALASACTKYVAIRALALPAVVVTTIAQAICIGTKDTKTPMISVGFAAVCNFVGDLILVKGFRQGIAGAAWATSFSQFLAAGLLLRALKRRGILERKETLQEPQSALLSSPVSTAATIKQLLSFIPFLFVMTIKIGWHNSCTATAASLGSIPAAAHTALLSVAMVCMILGDVGSSLSQAFLPAFESSKATMSGNAATSTTGKKGKTSKPISTFDMDAAMPTIRQLFKCTLSISATATAFAAIAIGIFGGQITSDPKVLAEMRKTLPWILATLSFHGSAVTLEGLLLSRKKFRPLSICYSILAISVVAFQVATRRFGLGLAGVWGCYVWVCASRVVTFSVLGGLLRPRRWFQTFRQGINLPDKANVE